ncbi:MAG: hypothetical protein OCD03_13100 [Hyphomicrobiales bacterium]
MIIAITRPDLYEHWNLSVNGKRPGVQLDEPKCGFYRSRKVKGGPWLPIAIWMQQEVDEEGNPIDDEYLVATFAGEQTNPDEIWQWCRPISEAAFNSLSNPDQETTVETQIQAGADLTEAKSIF